MCFFIRSQKEADDITCFAYTSWNRAVHLLPYSKLSTQFNMLQNRRQIYQLRYTRYTSFAYYIKLQIKDWKNKKRINLFAPDGLLRKLLRKFIYCYNLLQRQYKYYMTRLQAHLIIWKMCLICMLCMVNIKSVSL